MKSHVRARHFALTLAAALAVWPQNPADAAITWTGSGGTSWATPSSWSNNAGPSTTDTAIFTDTGSSTLPGDLTSALNADRTIGGLAFNNSSGKYHTLDLGGHTLTVNGILAFNLDRNSTNSTVVRNGNLIVSSVYSNVYVGTCIAADARSNTDLSGLSSLNVTAQSVQIATSDWGTANAILTLPSNTTISTTLLQVGATTGTDCSGTLHLANNTTILATEFDVGKNRAQAVVDIASGASLTLGSALYPMNLQIGVGNIGSNNTYAGRVDLTGATVNAYLSQLIVAQKDGGPGPGAPGAQNGTFIGGNAGSIAIGTPTARANCYIGYTINGGSSQGNVALGAMDSLQAYLTDMYVGYALSGSAAANVTLPSTSYVDANNSIVVGSGMGGLTSTLTLGLHTTIRANQIILGHDYGNGNIYIPTGGSLDLGTPSQPTSLLIATTTRSDNNGYFGRLDLTGTTLNAYIGQFIVAQKDGGSGPGAPGGVSGLVTGGNAGSVTIGSPTSLSSWYVGYTINGGSSQGNVDFSHMENLHAYLNDFLVGKALVGTAAGTVALPANSTIEAGSIVVGSSDTIATTQSALVLGAHTTILADQLTISENYAYGSVTIPGGGSLNLGSPTRRTNLSIAVGPKTATNYPFSGNFDLTDATVTAYLGNVTIGDKNAFSGSELGTLTISSRSENYIDATSIFLGGQNSTGTLNFAGGKLFAGAIAKGIGTANFNWTGGQLSVGAFGTPAINFNLQNTGTGTLAPTSTAGAIATTTIYGNYTQGSAAALNIRFTNSGNDLVAISGTASLAGRLNLSILDSFAPAVGQNFIIATYASRTGTFVFVAPPHLPQNAAFQLDYTSNTSQLQIHIVAPTNQTWISTAPNATFATAGNWNNAASPTTTSTLAITNNGPASQVVTVNPSTTVHRITLQGGTHPVTLEVPAGIMLGIANELVVNANATLTGGGQILGNVILNNGSLAPGALAPAAPNTLTMNALTLNADTTLAVKLVSPGNNDAVKVTNPDALNINGGQIQITSCPGDASSLGSYRILEYSGIVQGLGTKSVSLPIDPDPRISYSLETDANFISLHRGYLGDANDNGNVDLTDLAILGGHWQQAGAWNDGDFNHDGFVDLTDLATLGAQWQTTLASTTSNFSTDLEPQPSTPASPVPEPTTLLLVLPALFAFRRQVQSRSLGVIQVVRS